MYGFKSRPRKSWHNQSALAKPSCILCASSPRIMPDGPHLSTAGRLVIYMAGDPAEIEAERGVAAGLRRCSPVEHGSLWGIGFAENASNVSEVGWWIHNLVVHDLLEPPAALAKHFHVITGSAERLLLASSSRAVRCRSRISKTRTWKSSVSPSIKHFDWKQVLDMYTCTECGRCSSSSARPRLDQQAAGASPDACSIMRDQLYEHQDELIEMCSNGANGNCDGDKVARGRHEHRRR